MSKICNKKIKSIRNSINRAEVLAILKRAACPLSVDVIFYKVKEQRPKISLSTIYRIIFQLQENGVVRKVTTLADKRALYELVEDCHKHYIICTKCQKMFPIDSCPVENLEKQISSSTGFEITGHRFELYGICKECKDFV